MELLNANFLGHGTHDAYSKLIRNQIWLFIGLIFTFVQMQQWPSFILLFTRHGYCRQVISGITETIPTVSCVT